MTKQLTTNDIVKKLNNGMIDDPNELSKYLIILSASLYQGGLMETKTQIAYAKKWEDKRLECKTDRACDMAIMNEPEYWEWQKARTAVRAIIEIIRAIKKRLQNLSDEMSSGQNY